MLINNRKIKGNVTRYNISCSNFDIDGIRKIKALIKRKCTFVQETQHFTNKKQKDKNFVRQSSLAKIMTVGRCFEYKLIDNKYIYRMAIRVNDKGSHDTIYVLEPLYTDNGIFVKYVTVFTCRKGDYHLIKRIGGK